ncbi:hypothetical protein ACFXDE_01585 [Kitasatospora sp. NPDC059408]|uniref:hypothetical protein n=1 Tax=Kitasatospora sp. NPDC059408 TaxID=3346823 RepID=UPI003679614B
MTPEQDEVRRQAIRAAGLVLAQARAERDALTPREAAEAAFYPGHRLGSIDAIEALIIRQRAEADEQWRNGTHPYQRSPRSAEELPRQAAA